MKRAVMEVLRRGLDNTAVNWGLIVVRLIETVVFVAITVVAMLVIVLPIIVAIGIQWGALNTPESVAEAVLAAGEKWVLLIWIFVALTVLTLIFVALHSVVEAGCARVYVDGERLAGPLAQAPRTSYRVFSTARWMTGAREGWWTVFWIYNFAWGVAGLFLLIPLLPTLILTLVFRETPPVAIASGCIGLVVTLMLMIVVAVVTTMWTNRAITDWAVHRSGPAEALRLAWRSIRGDVGRHLLIALAMILITLLGSSFFASFSWIAAVGQAVSESPVYNVFTLPLRLAGTLLSSIFSALMSSWYLASYAALSVEGR